jgi:hypothetical protein
MIDWKEEKEMMESGRMKEPNPSCVYVYLALYFNILTRKEETNQVSTQTSSSNLLTNNPSPSKTSLTCLTVYSPL